MLRWTGREEIGSLTRNTDVSWGLIGNGERREEGSITTIRYCNPFHGELYFLLGPPET